MKKYALIALTFVVAAAVYAAGSSGIEKTGQLTEKKVNDAITVLDNITSSPTAVDATKVSGAISATTVTSAGAITVTDIPTGASGVILVDTDATGSNTNLLFSIGASLTIGADGAGTLVETNTASAAEYCIGILINGARYNILLEKP